MRLWADLPPYHPEPESEALSRSATGPGNEEGCRSNEGSEQPQMNIVPVRCCTLQMIKERPRNERYKLGPIKN
jgi:hypothetical protein